MDRQSTVCKYNFLHCTAPWIFIDTRKSAQLVPTTRRPRGEYLYFLAPLPLHNSYGDSYHEMAHSAHNIPFCSQFRNRSDFSPLFLRTLPPATVGLVPSQQSWDPGSRASGETILGSGPTTSFPVVNCFSGTLLMRSRVIRYVSDDKKSFVL